MVSYYLRNIVQNGPRALKNVRSRGRENKFLSLVITTAISRHSCKISRECFSGHSGIYPKQAQNTERMQREIQSDTCYEVFLSTLTVRSNTKSICIKFHKIRCRTALKNRGACIHWNEHWNTSKCLPAKVKMLWKGYFSGKPFE